MPVNSSSLPLPFPMATGNCPGALTMTHPFRASLSFSPRTSTVLFTPNNNNCFRSTYSVAVRTIVRIQRSEDVSNISSKPSSVGDWVPLFRVPSMVYGMPSCSLCRSYFCHCDPHHWLVTLQLLGTEFQSEEALFNYYIKVAACIVGSEDEAKKRIYLVSCGWTYGFGIEIDDMDAIHEYIADFLPLYSVRQDHFYKTRNKHPNVQLATRFTSMNLNNRLDNIHNYHLLSERNSKWAYDHWLIRIKHLDGEFKTTEHIFQFCVKMLAEVIGSEEEATQRIYAVWYTLPFGFGAVIDERSSNKLRERMDVVEVLPDYAFDIKKKYGHWAALHIYPSFHGREFSYDNLSEEYDSEDWLVGQESHVGEFDNPTLSRENFGLNLSQDPYVTEWGRKSDCKHWTVVITKPDDGFASRQEMIDCCSQTLAIALSVGSEEAKKRIYRVAERGPIVSFGAEIDSAITNKLRDIYNVEFFAADRLFNKYPRGDILSINGLRGNEMDWRCSRENIPLQDHGVSWVPTKERRYEAVQCAKGDLDVGQ